MSEAIGKKKSYKKNGTKVSPSQYLQKWMDVRYFGAWGKGLGEGIILQAEEDIKNQ